MCLWGGVGAGGAVAEGLLGVLCSVPRGGLFIECAQAWSLGVGWFTSVPGLFLQSPWSPRKPWNLTVSHSRSAGKKTTIGTLLVSQGKYECETLNLFTDDFLLF